MSSKIEPVSRPLLAGWTKLALVAASVIAYQVAVYCLVVYHPGEVLGESLMIAPLLVVACCVLARARLGRAVLALLAVAGILGLLQWHDSEIIATWLYPVPYLVIYVGLLWLFGRTLRTGQQPLITRLATHVHGEISVQMARYTRRVTQAWCVFFAAMAGVSLLLFLFEPLPVWSVFNSFLNLPLVVTMYLGEYAWRTWRYPDFPHASIATVFRAFRDFDFKRHVPGR